MPGAAQLAYASVAPGGRLIAVTDFAVFASESVDILLVNPAGAVVQTVADRYARQYLERGTADLRFVSGGGVRFLLDLEGTGNPALDAIDDEDLSERIAPGVPRSLDRVVVSPLGDWAAIQTAIPGDPAVDRWDLVPLPAGTAQPVVAFVLDQECVTPGNGTDCPALISSGAAWAHDSRRVVVTLPYGDLAAGDLVAIRSRIASIPFTNGAPQVGPLSTPIPGVWLLHPRITSDDVLFVTEDADLLAESCVETRRLAVGPFTERGTRPVVNLAFGDPFYGDGPGIFNSRWLRVARR